MIFSVYSNFGNMNNFQTHADLKKLELDPKKVRLYDARNTGTVHTIYNKRNKKRGKLVLFKI